MALIKCPECGRDISDMASSCPSCGCPINHKEKKKVSKKIILGLSLMILIISGAIGFILLSINDKTLGEKAVINSFKELDKILFEYDSIDVYECVSRDFTKDEDYNPDNKVGENNEPRKDVMVYINFSSSDKNGETTESEYIFACDKDGNVIEYMDLDDMEDEIANGTMSALIMDYDNYVFFASLNGWDEDYVIYTKDEIEKFMK